MVIMVTSTNFRYSGNEIVEVMVGFASEGTNGLNINGSFNFTGEEYNGKTLEEISGLVKTRIANLLNE
jgi:hypothetical protein